MSCSVGKWMICRQKGKTEYAQRRAGRQKKVASATVGMPYIPTQYICNLMRLQPQKEHVSFPTNKVYFVAFLTGKRVDFNLKLHTKVSTGAFCFLLFSAVIGSCKILFDGREKWKCGEKVTRSDRAFKSSLDTDWSGFSDKFKEYK